MQSVMACPICGNIRSSDARFCSECGFGYIVSNGAQALSMVNDLPALFFANMAQYEQRFCMDCLNPCCPDCGFRTVSTSVKYEIASALTGTNKQKRGTPAGDVGLQVHCKKLIDAGMYEECIELAERGLIQFPKKTVDYNYLIGLSRFHRSTQYHKQGREKRARKELKKAKKAFVTVVLIKNDHTESFYYLGLIDERMGKLRSAAAYYRRALIEESDFKPAMDRLNKIGGSKSQCSFCLARFTY